MRISLNSERVYRNVWERTDIGKILAKTMVERVGTYPHKAQVVELEAAAKWHNILSSGVPAGLAAARWHTIL